MRLEILAVLFIAIFGSAIRGDDQDELLSSATDFAQRLRQKLDEAQESCVFSPLSLHSILTMAYLGARNETESEMLWALNLTSLPGNAAHDAYHDLIAKFIVETEVKTNTGKAIYINPDKTIEEDYKRDVESKYWSRVKNFDLNDPEGPEKDINQYLFEKTEGMIEETIPKGTVTAETSVILVNAIVFNGTWENRFDKKKTEKQDFYRLDGSIAQVDMMNDSRTVLMKRDNDSKVDVVSIPFKGGRFELSLAIPQEKDGLSDLEKLMDDPRKVKELWEGLSPRYTEVVIPKFKIESKLDLKSKLIDLGIVKAFDPSEADFSGISKEGKLHISTVIHKALIDLHEDGTVASESTSVGSPGSGAADEKIKADRPFIFFIRDNLTKHLVFQGKFVG